MPCDIISKPALYVLGAPINCTTTPALQNMIWEVYVKHNLQLLNVTHPFRAFISVWCVLLALGTLFALGEILNCDISIILTCYLGIGEPSIDSMWPQQPSPCKNQPSRLPGPIGSRSMMSPFTTSCTSPMYLSNIWTMTSYVVATVYKIGYNVLVATDQSTENGHLSTLWVPL